MFPLTVAFKPGIICLAIMFCQLSASCQQWDWAQAITDSGVSAGAGHSIAVDKNGDLYISSGEVLGYELAVVFVSKYDTSGNLIWKRSAQTASGSGKVAVDKAGNVFFSGMFYKSIDFGNGISYSSLGSDDIFLAKYNSSGTLLWAKKAGGTLGDDLTAIAVDIQGNVCIGGASRSPSFYFDSLTLAQPPTSQELYLAKYDASGNVLWARLEKGSETAGSYSDGLAAMKTDPLGNIYAMGFFSDSARFDNILLNTTVTGRDMFIAKYKANGEVLWAKASGNHSVTPFDMTMDNWGNLLVTGGYTGSAFFAGSGINSSGPMDMDIFIAKFDPDGNPIWARSGGGNSPEYEIGFGIGTDSKDNIYVTGSYGSGAKFCDTMLTTLGNEDVFVARYDSSGAWQGILPGGSVGWDRGRSIVATAVGICYITGFYSSALDQTPIPGFFGAFTLRKSIWGNALFAKATMPVAVKSSILFSFDTVCNIQLSHQLKYIKTPGTVGVDLYYDTTIIKVISVNDSLILFNFLQYGTSTVKIVLRGACRSSMDSTRVTAAKNRPHSFSLGPDLGICLGAHLKISAGKGFQSYLWQDGSKDSTFTVTLPGAYSVAVSDDCGNQYRDTVIVTSMPVPIINLGPDREKCNKDSIHLSAPTGFAGYNWQPLYNISGPDLQDPIVYPERDTNYILTVKNEQGCSAADTIRVRVNHSQPISLGPDTSICPNTSLALSVGGSFESYIWSNGETTQAIAVNAPAYYSVQATDSKSCVSSDTILVSLKQFPSVFLGRDTTICEKDKLVLDASWPGSRYLWQDGSTAAAYTVNIHGTYYCKVSNSCGDASDTIVINDKKCECSIWVPSGFTPNGDGKNDLFKSYLSCNPEFFEMIVYNKWGQSVFQTRDLSHGWNGTRNNLPQPPGVYVYKIRMKQDTNGSLEERVGTVTLIR